LFSYSIGRKQWEREREREREREKEDSQTMGEREIDKTISDTSHLEEVAKS
jgi:hypothetical protein